MTLIPHVTVQSPANIAFIKYWGQRDAALVLPYNDSFSMNLSACYTTIRIESTENPTHREVLVQPYHARTYSPAPTAVLASVEQYLGTVQAFISSEEEVGYVLHVTHSFPHKAGIASSASFFSALALGFVTMLGRKLEQKDLSILARLSGSGSAARSIPDGFVWWYKGSATGGNEEGATPSVEEVSQSSYAESVGGVDAWDLRDIVLVVSAQEKKIGSQEGHTTVETSPFFPDRLLSVHQRLQRIEDAFANRDFTTFGEVLEEETISMHSVMMTQQQGLFFWTGGTLDAMRYTQQLRAQGTQAYYTIDAGQNVHVLCKGEDEQKVVQYFRDTMQLENILVNKSVAGARVVEE